jgi:hypothetical protein
METIDYFFSFHEIKSIKNTFSLDTVLDRTLLGPVCLVEQPIPLFETLTEVLVYKMVKLSLAEREALALNLKKCLKKIAWKSFLCSSSFRFCFLVCGKNHHV